MMTMATMQCSSGQLRLPARPLARASFRAARSAPRALVVRAAASQGRRTVEEQSAVVLLAAAGVLAPLVLHTEAAQAVPELLTGRTASLIHPGRLTRGRGSRALALPSSPSICRYARCVCTGPPSSPPLPSVLAAVMAILFGVSGYAGYLGFQWRRARELVGEIKAIKGQLPPAGADGIRPPSPLDAQVGAAGRGMSVRRWSSHSVMCWRSGGGGARGSGRHAGRRAAAAVVHLGWAWGPAADVQLGFWGLGARVRRGVHDPPLHWASWASPPQDPGR